MGEDTPREAACQYRPCPAQDPTPLCFQRILPKRSDPSRETSGKGDYVFALKGSQGLFYEEIRGYFEESVLEKLKGEEVCYKKTAGF